MALNNQQTAGVLTLPTMISTPADVGRLLRELDMINDSVLSWKLRKAGDELRIPKTSYLMDRLVTHNKANLLILDDRQRLANFLQAVKTQAPLLHFSFGTDPPANFMEQLMSWLRLEIHPFVLVHIGLQPNIGVGCVVRGINHRFDLSLRENFNRNRDLLIQQLALMDTEVTK
ncbi:MAG TPA: hypothetical protein VLF79_02915 [Candidatus Saccharimonadales bacterium]|nr:hypothetical protein [Candidatus Saccharimonadales bacterium]